MTTLRLLAISFGTTLVLALSGCLKSASDRETATPSAESAGAKKGSAGPAEGDGAPASAEEPHQGVMLKPEEIRALGIELMPARPMQHTPELSGFATVMPHEPIAAALAELRTGRAAASQSRAAAERAQRLEGTPGAMPADAMETAQRQSAADQAALDLARQRLSASLGPDAPWRDRDDDARLGALASGRMKLVRVTFSTEALRIDPPASIRLARIGSSPASQSWSALNVWSAPADPTVPGRSFFAILKPTDLAEGEHLRAWMSVGSAESGLAIPASAAVINAGRFWCYVEQKPGTFLRVALDPERSVDDGYFVRDGIDSQARIVVRGAGILLAREMNPTDAEAP